MAVRTFGRFIRCRERGSAHYLGMPLPLGLLSLTDTWSIVTRVPEQANCVLVLGAGASVAEAKGFRPKQERDHPPLDGNFFSRAARHVPDARLAPIMRRAERLGQPDLCSTARRVSLELYLGRLYFTQRRISKPITSLSGCTQRSC
jgi:hypothetical protein